MYSGMPEVRVYTTQVCGYCSAAKALLKKKNVPFQEIDVSHDPEKRAWLVSTTGQRTVPQIFIGDESIGGFDELSALDKSGALDPMLR